MRQNVSGRNSNTTECTNKSALKRRRISMRQAECRSLQKEKEIGGMSSIAVIMARSGSKGLKYKNIKLLNGKPLMAYSIEAAKESGCFTCIHVSTDSEKYAEIAKEYGADVPFLREPELASDTSDIWDAVRIVLKKYEQMGKKFERVMLLQPTSPLRTAQDIRNAFSLIEEKNAEAVIGVCEMDHTPLWSNTLPEDGNMKGFQSMEYEVPRQQLPVYYRVNGAIYLVNIDFLMRRGDLYDRFSHAYIMPKERSVDIDNIVDFLLVEIYMQQSLS